MKKQYVEKQLGGKFEFISHIITKEEKEYVKKNTKKTHKNY